jgi:hypothetical protein
MKTLKDEKFAILYPNVSQARARLKICNFEVVQNAARAGNWQAAAWILKGRFPAPMGSPESIG